VRLAWPLTKTALIAAAALIALLAIPKLSTPHALAIWVVIVTALVLLTLVRQAREPKPASRFEQALRRGKPANPQPEELLRMDRELLLGIAEADHAHRQLLPHLRAVAAARIGARHGFELERRPETARALLGDDVWELLRPDRPEPKDRHGPGVPRSRVAAVIDRVESL
jgi:hypothetical protein